MAIEPFIKCSDISISLRFYTEVLDFECIRLPDPDPKSFMSRYALIQRSGDRLHLSSHSGDGVFGNVIYIRVDEIAPLYSKFLSNGLDQDDPSTSPTIAMKPTEQSWGMKEFTICDPDGNRITYGQALA